MRKISMKKVMVSMAVGTLMMAVPVITQAKAAAPTISVVSEYGEDYLTWSNVALTTDQELVIQASTDAAFNLVDGSYYLSSTDSAYTAGKLDLDYLGLDAGETYNVRAYILDFGDENSDYSAVASYTADVGRAYVSLYDVTKKKVVVSMSADGADGYEIYRAIGKKCYQKIAVSSDSVYTDSGLYKDTDYSYKVVPYAYVNGAKVYGEAGYASIGTYGKAMNVKAVAASSNKVKVTWAKVPGASGYEVYRMANSSNSSTYTNEIEYKNKDFSNMKLVATKKKKAKSYTDKKVKAGSYTYYVIAYRMVDGKKVYAESGRDSVGLKAGSYSEISSVTNADGSETVTWKKAVGISGYLITKGGVNYAVLGADATSYTFPARANADDDDGYVLYSYTDNERYYLTSVYTTTASPSSNSKAQGKVTNINAASTGTGIQVTWDAVAGADYYTVYRSTEKLDYNEDYAGYRYYSDEYDGTAVRVVKETTEYGYSYKSLTSSIETNSVLDTVAQLTNDEGKVTEKYDGPKAGVTYYYYVTAHVKGATDADSYTINCDGNYAKVKISAAQATAKIKKFTVKAGKKGQVIVKIKKAKGAKYFKVYASNKKKGAYQVVASSSKKKIKVKGLQAGKTYIKVVAVTENEAGADVESKLSKAKAVKVK